MRLAYILAITYIGSNLYIFRQTLKTINPQRKFVKISLSLLYWIVALSFFLPFAIKSGNTLLIKTATILGGFWFFGTFSMFILLLISKLLGKIFISFKYGFITSATLTTIFLLYGYINYTHIHKQRIEIITEKDIERPLKIVAISDIHLGYITGKNRCKKIVETINSENPDLILIAGDLIDNSIEPVKKAHLEEELQNLKATHGVYMAPGNHDYICGIDNYSAFANASGITLLIDSVATIERQLQIIGRDDYSNRHRQNIEKLMSKVDSNLATIVIDHQPQHLRQTAKHSIDLQISGHTHNGQVFPLNYIIKHLYEQGYGYRKWGNGCHIYVSSGISLWGAPIRIGTVNEIVVFTLKSNN